MGVNRTERPVTNQVFDEPIGVLEGLEIVNCRHGEAMGAGKSRNRFFRGPILEVLRTTRRQISRVKVRCTVIDSTAPGVGCLKHQAIAEATHKTALQPMVRRIADWQVSNNVAAETGSLECRYEFAGSVQSIECERKGVQGRLRRRLQVCRQEVLGIYLGPNVDSVLHIKVDTPGADIFGFRYLILCK